jgi:hypothetical protein
LPLTVAAPNEAGNSRSFTAAFWPNQSVRSSTAPASTQLFRPPPPQPQMMVGAWPAPIAVRIFVLYASFSNAVCLIWVSALALLKRSTARVRICSPGAAVRNQ